MARTSKDRHLMGTRELKSTSIRLDPDTLAFLAAYGPPTKAGKKPDVASGVRACVRAVMIRTEHDGTWPAAHLRHVAKTDPARAEAYLQRFPEQRAALGTPAPAQQPGTTTANPATHDGPDSAADAFAGWDD